MTLVPFLVPPSTCAAMYLSVAAAMLVVAHAQVPSRPASWRLNQSTIIMCVGLMAWGWDDFVTACASDGWDRNC